MNQTIEAAAKGEPRVTIIVVPRERYGMAKSQLENIYATAAEIPFDLVYIDNRSPRHLSEWLGEQSTAKGFTLLGFDRYLTPNEARNIGVAASKTEYVVFIDNDVLGDNGWLSALVATADETGVDVVAPLTCEGLPLHSRVHQATGAFTHDEKEFFAAAPGERILIDEMVHLGVPLADVRDQIERAPTQMCEFHCVLIRKSIFDKIGPLDEELYATKEHVDFCIRVAQVGGRAVLEPKSVVTYVFPNSKAPLTREDRDYFLLRWSPEWQVRSLDHLKKKWALKEAEELIYVSNPEYMRQRQEQGFINPLIKKTPVVSRSYKLRGIAHWVLRRYTDMRVRTLANEYEVQKAASRKLGAAE